MPVLRGGAPARSALFVPAHQDRMIQKARALPADCLLIDLEDSVPPDAKDAGRQALSALPAGTPSAVVRINALDTEYAVDDIAAAANSTAVAIMLPKAESRDDLVVLDYLLTRFERQAGRAAEDRLDVWVTIETAQGLVAVAEILSASDRITGVALGVAEGGDLYRGLGARASSDGHELLYARSKIVAHARARKIPNLLEGPYVQYNDDDGLRAQASSARGLGFTGKAAIHPRQVEILNEAFSPTPEELDYHQRVAAAMTEALGKGAAATTVDGKMVDIAMLHLARAVLEQAGADSPETDHREESSDRDA